RRQRGENHRHAYKKHERSHPQPIQSIILPFCQIPLRLLYISKGGLIFLSVNKEKIKIELSFPTILPHSASSLLIKQAIMSAEIGRAPRLNSSHVKISYAVFCLKKKKK